MNIALILSGGMGTRLQSEIPKQYRKVCGKPVIAYCMERVLECEEISGLWVVAEKRWEQMILEACIEQERICGFSPPGRNRALSIWNGLRGIRDYLLKNGNGIEDVAVIIHDAARPLVSVETIKECIRACRTHDGAMPVLQMTDTVYYGNADGSGVECLLDRSRVFAGQAPEAFAFKKYLAAVEALLPERILSVNGSAEPAILAGLDVALIQGDYGNFKITTQEDMERFERICKTCFCAVNGFEKT